MKEDKGCGNCRFYDGEYCTALWNNGDPAYKVEERDRVQMDDYCECWEEN